MPEVLQTPVPLVHHIMIVDVPVVKQHQAPTIQTDRKTVEVHQSQQTVRVVVVLIVSPQQVKKFPEDAKDGRVSTCDAHRQNPRSTRRDAGQVLIIRTVQTLRLHKPSTSRELTVVSAVRQWDIMVPRHADDRRRRSTFQHSFCSFPLSVLLVHRNGRSSFSCRRF